MAEQLLEIAPLLRRRLGLNSGNSHKPPSSDGYRKKGSDRPCPKEKRVSGGQPGHKGKTLRRVERPGRVDVHLPEQCKVCGREIAADEPHPAVGRSQGFDLPEPKLEAIEHRLGQIECSVERSSAGNIALFDMDLACGHWSSSSRWTTKCRWSKSAACSVTCMDMS